MTVEVRLFATLAQFLPSSSKAGTTVLDLPEGATIADVMRRLRIPAGLECVLLRNGANADAEARLREGDVIDIFPPLAGGCHEPGVRSGSCATRARASISAPTRSVRLER